jgi:hypothetical protein
MFQSRFQTHAQEHRSEDQQRPCTAMPAHNPMWILAMVRLPPTPSIGV